MNNNPASQEKNSAVLKIFNYVGGALIFFGVAYFVQSNWDSLNDFFKVFVSLGVAIAAYIVGLLLQSANKSAASAAFFLIAGLMLPLGLYITSIVYNIPIPQKSVDLLISLICFLVFLISLFLFRSPRILFQFFSILYASCLYFSVIEFLLYGHSVFIEDLTQYELIALGLSYIFLGYYLDISSPSPLSSSSPLTTPLYIIGALTIFVAAYFLGDFNDPRLIYYWRIPVIVCIILAFLFALPLKAKSFLYLGSLFMVIYILEMSAKFASVFGDSGWSLILVIAGLLFMGLGYLVFILNKMISNSDSKSL
jgi:uncharacterized membrane protein